MYDAEHELKLIEIKTKHAEYQRNHILQMNEFAVVMTVKWLQFKTFEFIGKCSREALKERGEG